MSIFFIDRPIFAWVIALSIMLVGALSILKLPINQYPAIAPTAIDIQVIYPGASAQIVQDTVVQVIEQQLNGIDNLRYIASDSNSDGSMTITATFNHGTNPDIAQVQVHNKLSLATPLLPQEVQQQGIRVTKSAKNFLMVVGLVSEDGSMTKDDLSNYIVSNIQDQVSRTAGVGDFQVFGSQYAMRIWLDPAKLNIYQLTPVDVSAAIRAQNIQVATGQLGGMPAIPGTHLNATITGKTRLKSAEEFAKILMQVNSDGSQVCLGDIARIELGSQNYNISTQFNGKPASGMAIKLATGANALDTAKAIYATVASIEPFFPPGMKVIVPYDTTPVMTESISSVIYTLGETIVLVFLVMLLFLQNFRATIIATMTIPVVLLGTFGILAATGFTINTLTMFGIILAIGLLVDDAIVVVENIERVMAEEHLSPKEATIKSMGQIYGALVGITLILSAIMLPMAFFGGSTGVIYRQFSITIVSAMALSVLVAMIFTPVLCATMLKPINPKKYSQLKCGFFGWFNRTFDLGLLSYEHGVNNMIKHKIPAFLMYALILTCIIWMFTSIPSAFLPEEDQGVIFAQVQAPDNTSTEYTQKVIDDMTTYLLNDKEDKPGEGKAVKSVFTINGFNFAGRGQSSGLAFVQLKPWSERDANMSAFKVAKRAQHYFFTAIKEALVFVVVPPSVLELGNSNGFDIFLQDQGGVGHDKLMAAQNQFLGAAAQSKILANVRSNGMNDAPQYEITVDDEKASVYGVSLIDIQQTIAIALGGIYINDFIDRGRVKKVYVQGDADSRMSPEDLNKWYVRNASGKMIPLSTISSCQWIFGSTKLSRYNGLAAIEILGTPAPGYSTGNAITEVKRIAEGLPSGIGYSWTGLSYEERMSSSQAPTLYALSLVIVFLCLAALYESWSIPIVVILVVPLGIIGTLIATSLRDLSNDVFFQVGLLVTIGLAAKNAILIVEFAKELYEHGKGIAESVLEASRMRLRPIIMTSMVFMLGVLPLAISSGPGSGSQHAIGTGVIGGMITATVLVIFWVPLFFVTFAGKRKKTVNTKTTKEFSQ
ncbi:efflux RND transporter permease subunit [Candidatus Pseudomonas adelgestsugas]|uniref:Efflux pump membrane transporter n=1 Tax=Candidatus Pseudomonas adelgestsugas TaxID=1302376 RepID=A0ABX5R8T8_9PSED|nr:efflux RND transporter permease subunit [Candidatus Pseudomonas adelgestsugas]QAX82055.1 putative efflux pump membrane transporter TtgB [Candidatus Pseudomonas adelgestsugas]